MKSIEIQTKLTEKGLKVTPQRMAILQAIYELNNHPTAENIIDHIRKSNPNIAIATVYKVLDALHEKGLIMKVKTDKDFMRYEATIENHHHLYDSSSDRIEDFRDDELNQVLEMYFEKKGIPNFKIEDIKLQIIGKFISNS